MLEIGMSRQLKFERYNDLIIPTIREYTVLNGKLTCTRITELSWKKLHTMPPAEAFEESDMVLQAARQPVMSCSELHQIGVVWGAGDRGVCLPMRSEDFALAERRLLGLDSGEMDAQVELSPEDEWFESFTEQQSV